MLFGEKQTVLLAQCGTQKARELHVLGLLVHHKASGSDTWH